MKKDKLIMLPGLDGTGILLEKTKEIFNQVFDAEIISYPENEALSYSDLINFIEKKLPEEDFFLLAESFGGPIAIELTIRNPDKIKGLILSATFSKNPLFIENLKIISSLLSTKHIPDFVLNFVFFGGLANKKDIKLLQNVLENLNQNVIKNRINEVLELKESSKITNIKKPVLYLQGDYDNLILKHNFLNLKESIPHIKKINVESGHMVLQKQPDYCLRKFLDFIRLKN